MEGPEEINRALILYIGKDINPWPDGSFSRVIAEFGESKGNDLLKQVDSILKITDEIKIDWDRFTLVEASKYAASQVSLEHPYLNNEALSAIEWMCAFGWK